MYTLSQAVPDGNFPTCPYPNPENPDAWKLALELAKEKDADIVLATDPDADRLGVYCKDTKTGEYVTFIDGDDWVEPKYISYLLNLVESNKCEMA